MPTGLSSGTDMREFGRTDVSVRRCGRGFLPQGERGHGPRDRDRVARPVLLRVSIEAETPARHQENSAGSVVWALPNFLGVWCIEPPRERECEGELSPSRSRG